MYENVMFIGWSVVLEEEFVGYQEVIQVIFEVNFEVLDNRVID